MAYFLGHPVMGLYSQRVLCLWSKFEQIVTTLTRLPPSFYDPSFLTGQCCRQLKIFLFCQAIGPALSWLLRPYDMRAANSRTKLNWTTLYKAAPMSHRQRHIARLCGIPRFRFVDSRQCLITRWELRSYANEFAVDEVIATIKNVEWQLIIFTSRDTIVTGRRTKGITPYIHCSCKAPENYGYSWHAAKITCRVFRH